MSFDDEMKGGFISKDILKGPDGKPIFTGKDVLIPPDKAKCPYCRKVFEFVREPTITCPFCHKIVSESSKMECPVCHSRVDYLLGETNTFTGEQQGCEGCWKPAKRK